MEGPAAPSDGHETPTGDDTKIGENSSLLAGSGSTSREDVH